MADLVERFNRFKQDLASEERAKPKRRLDKIQDRLAPWEIVTMAQNEKYREGWDRIFGSKTGNPVSDESKP